MFNSKFSESQLILTQYRTTLTQGRSEASDVGGGGGGGGVGGGGGGGGGRRILLEI
jgi:uncharacterized membrane protein